MLSVSIGPLAFPVTPLVTLLAVWIAASVARRLAIPSDHARAENAIWLAALIGLICARLVYLVIHRDAYLQYPWSAFDIRDGGWLASAGFLAAALWLLQRIRQYTALRRAIIGGALAGLAVWSAANFTFQTMQSDGAQRAVPAIPVKSLSDGKQVNLAQVIAGKPALVNLWASWCGPCRVEMPVLADAQQRYDDIHVVFVNQGESAAAVNRFLSQSGLNLRQVWLDEHSALGPAIGSTGLPTTLFYDAQGRQVDAHFGILNAASLAAKVSMLRSGSSRGVPND